MEHRKKNVPTEITAFRLQVTFRREVITSTRANHMYCLQCAHWTVDDMGRTRNSCPRTLRTFCDLSATLRLICRPSWGSSASLLMLSGHRTTSHTSAHVSRNARSSQTQHRESSINSNMAPLIQKYYGGTGALFCLRGTHKKASMLSLYVKSTDSGQRLTPSWTQT